MAGGHGPPQPLSPRTPALPSPTHFRLGLIGQYQHWYRLAARNPYNLADIPAVRALAGRRRSQWADAEWPEWEELDYVAVRAHGHVTGQEDSLYDALDGPLRRP